MDYGLIGMIMDRRGVKEVLKMGNTMDYGLIGTIVDRRRKN